MRAATDAERVGRIGRLGRVESEDTDGDLKRGRAGRKEAGADSGWPSVDCTDVDAGGKLGQENNETDRVKGRVGAGVEGDEQVAEVSESIVFYLSDFMRFITSIPL